MRGFFKAPLRTTDEIAAIVQNYRLISFGCGSVILAFGIVRAITQQGGQDPLCERLLIALACFAYAASTYFDNPVRRSPVFFMTALCCLIFSFVIHLAFLTNFSVNSCFAILLVSFIISLVLNTLPSMFAFQIVAFCFTAIMMIDAEITVVSPLFFLSTLACVCFFTFMNQGFRIETEESLRFAKQEALEAAEARSQFLANMSHEIRTPMNGVIGMTHLLGGTELDTTQKNYLNTIQVSGEALLSIINDILDFSKVDAGELTLDFHQFDLTECFENSAELVTQACQHKQLGLYLIFEPGVPQSVKGDSTRLRQVIINLLNNAVKFTGEGAVTLRVSGKYSEDGFDLACEVSDTGIGIEPESMQQLFKAFSQADTSTTRKYGGTGLGLSISKHLIELMGGNIDVESEVGVGSTFSFRIPVTNPIHQTPDAELQKALDRLRAGEPNVMIYIENPNARQSLINFLFDSRIPFEDADCRSNAASLLRACTHEFVFTDAVFTRDLMAHKSIIFIESDSANPPNLRADKIIQQPVKPSRIRELILEDALTRATRSDTNTADFDGSEIRILLAEDNLINQKVATKMLEKYGFDVDVANDGAEALIAIRNRKYDLVLMDIQMPELSGLKVTEQVRSEGEHCPIVGLTANAFEEDRQACLSAGMDAYISKPIRSETLDHVIQQTIRH
jgi:signal transduction histidine kinase